MQPRVTILIMMLCRYSPLLPLIYPPQNIQFCFVLYCFNANCSLRNLLSSSYVDRFWFWRVVHLRKVVQSSSASFQNHFAQISVLNNVKSSICTKECILTFSSKVHPCVRIPAKTFVITKVTGNLPSSNFDISCFNSLPDIPLADSEFYRNSKIEMLIGCELLPSIMSSGIRRNICGSLLAQETVFF